MPTRHWVCAPAELSGFSRKSQATVEPGPGSQKSVIRSRKVAWRLPIRNEEALPEFGEPLRNGKSASCQLPMTGLLGQNVGSPHSE